MKIFATQLLCLLLLLPACGQQLVEFPDDGKMDASASDGGSNGARPDAGDAPTDAGGTDLPDSKAPFVTATVPASDALDVALNGVITARFSEEMDANTLNALTFSVRHGTTAVPGAITYTGTTARFEPASDLTEGTIYAATISTGAKDLSGNALAAAYTWLFTTGTGPDGTAPTVVSTIPARDAPDAPVNGAVLATFSEAMDPLTLNTTSFTVHRGMIPISGTVSSDGMTAVFAPLQNLATNTVYTAAITTAATDVAGNALAAIYTWQFTTGTADTVAPSVVSTLPAPNGLDAPINDPISATFSEAMDPTDLETSFTLTQGASAVAGMVTALGTTAVFTPTSALEENTVYTATISVQATDLAGNGLVALHTWQFTTGMTPTVVDVSPDSNAVNVLRDVNVVVTFSEPMDQATLIAANLTVMDGATQVSGTTSNTATTLTFDPTSDLDPNTTYTATVTRGVTDVAGTPLAVAYSWEFTTGTTPDSSAPTVTSTIPDRDALDVPVNSRVIATFSEPMATATLNATNFTLSKAGTSVLGTVSPVGETAVFKPNVALDPGEVYTATVSTGVTDAAGNALAADYTWDFTTGVSLDTTAPTVIAISPAPVPPALTAINVSVSARPTATFSEPMEPTSITQLTFTLRQGLLPVLGSVSYDVLNKKATFTPNTPLALNTSYEATITTGAEDLAGNPLPLDESWTFTTSACGQSKVVLGAAGNFVVLAGSTVTSTGPTSVTGNLGVSPGTALTGFPPGTLVGNKEAGTPAAALGIFDLTTAYNDAKGRTLCPITTAGNLGGKTLAPGLYKSTSSLEISSGELTLDAQGDGNAVFIFQMASTLTVTPGRQVILIGGAKAANIFWQVGTSATLGTTSVFKGTVMADQAITMGTGARIEGRVLARIAAVSLDSNIIVTPAP